MITKETGIHAWESRWPKIEAAQSDLANRLLAVIPDLKLHIETSRNASFPFRSAAIYMRKSAHPYEDPRVVISIDCLDQIEHWLIIVDTCIANESENGKILDELPDYQISLHLTPDQFNKELDNLMERIVAYINIQDTVVQEILASIKANKI